MARYEINGGRPLNGSVYISGAKNAVVAILPAALLVKGKCRIENVPDISDVWILLRILGSMGAKIEVNGKTATINGREKLKGNTVIARDLRAGAALVILLF